ncbi:MAG: YegS/Rv2252/BmrU family lipid kinase [Chitinophagaceae bacterium]
MPSTVFIINGRSDTKKIQAVKQAVESFFEPHNFQIFLTEYGGHALDLTKKAISNGAQTIVAVGGDGTVNEILQQVATEKINLGVVPLGSGNGLARHCKIPLQIKDSVALIHAGHKSKIDIGLINNIYFISNAGVGFDAFVCNTIKQANSRGLKMYFKYVIKHYFSYKASNYTIYIDEKKVEERAYFLNIANGKEFGYGFKIAGQASIQDGLFDIIMVKKMDMLSATHFVFEGWRNRIRANKNIALWNGKRIKIVSDKLTLFQADGDAHPCEGQCTIQILPNQLSLIVPQNTNL